MGPTREIQFKLRVMVIVHRVWTLLGSKDLGFYVFRTLMCIVGKPWSKQDD